MNKLKIAFFSIITLTIFLFVAFITYTYAEPKAYDFMIKNVTTERLPFDNNKNIYGHDDIVLVVIDNKSVERYRWPWKRDLNCKIFEYFSKYAKPKVFVHDSIFTTLDSDNPASDKKYFKSLQTMPYLVEGFMYRLNYEDAERGKNYDKIFTEKYGLKNVNLKVYMPQIFKGMITSPPEFLNSVKNIGSITIIPGFINGNQTDDIYRTHNYFMRYNDSVLPSLAMSAFLTANNYPKIEIDKKFISFPELNYKIKHKISPYIPISNVPIKYYKMQGQYSHKYYSAVDIMDSYDNIQQGKKPKISPEIFKDKIIILGVNDPLKDGLNDNKSTPMRVNHPAMDIQASSIDNLMHKDFLTILPGWINVLIIILGMLFVYYTIRTHKLIKAIIYTFIIIGLNLAISFTCFYYGVVTNTITPVVMCTVTIIVAYIRQYLIENKNKEKVTSALGKYMSEDVMKDVLKNIDNLGLGGKKATVTVLFSDIRGFTSLSENMSAQQVSELLNEYFSEMEPIVSKYNGIINKFIGDAVMAVFGEPINDDNHPVNAVKCGLEMLKKVEELDKKWKSEGKPAIQIGVGVNTGEVFIGNIGSEKRMEYTVIGDTVNLASRLESYNKTYKTHMLISSTTYEKSKDYISVNKISDVEIRGKAEKMDIYEVKNIVL